MNTYPATIQSAAKLLDKQVPSWYNQIVKPLDMSHCRTCILGQVYDSYEVGMKDLFGHSLTSHNSFDMVFGRNASIDVWNEEIRIRTDIYVPKTPKAKITAEVYTVYYDNQTIKIKTDDMPMLIEMFQKAMKGE